MTIYGREVGFYFSVGAKVAISNLDSDTSPYLRTAAAMAILSEQHEKRQAFIDPTYKGRPLTLDEVLSLSSEQFEELCAEMNKAIEEDGKVSVEVETKKNEETTSS